MFKLCRQMHLTGNEMISEKETKLCMSHALHQHYRILLAYIRIIVIIKFFSIKTYPDNLSGYSVIQIITKIYKNTGYLEKHYLSKKRKLVFFYFINVLETTMSTDN